ncbi:MAG: phenylalanine--tRNA ligase subunit alpha [Eubacteriales bacterium]
MQEKLNAILNEVKTQIGDENLNVARLMDIKVKALGKKSELMELLKSTGKLPQEERKNFGAAVNSVKAQIESLIEEKRQNLKKIEMKLKLAAERIDVTEPAKKVEIGGKHPISIMIDEISDVFMSMGFSIEEGPEVETVYYNFDALNAEPNHPARDMTDTFYINSQMLLRTQTSPVQARVISKQKPPIKIISPGRCFRCDTPDATHSPMFHQVEGLLVDEGITMADLKGTLDSFAHTIFGSDVRTKFRPHHFPFTEPSAEMDVSCFKCGGSGCNVCKSSGWIEILGCGMVHPNVLAAGGIDTEKYTGFAFGMGVERIAMLKYGVDDIRNFYENDMRFINQFK